MRVVIIAGVLAATVACASRGAVETVPTIASFNDYVVGVRLWQDSGGCNRVVAYADGSVVYTKEPAELCAKAATWTKAHAAAAAKAAVPSPAAPR